MEICLHFAIVYIETVGFCALVQLLMLCLSSEALFSAQNAPNVFCGRASLKLKRSAPQTL